MIFFCAIIIFEKQRMRSNCLLQALKAKIKNPRVHFFKLPKCLNDAVHFMWCDDEFYYHAYNLKRNKNFLLYDYKIKKIPRYIFESFALTYIEWYDVKFKIKIARKCFMKLADYKSEWDWSFQEFKHDKLPSQEYLDFFEKVMRTKTKFKLCINGQLKTATLKELKSQKCDFEWKMIDLYDPDFARVYRGHVKSDYTELED